ncbi:MAG: DUF4276 family protein [Roseiarcus sp.]
MSGIAIYLEGGGDGKESRAELRRGMDAFLGEIKDAARLKTLRWKLVACGGRQQAYEGFVNTDKDLDYSIRVLLVDAEGPVASTRTEHLHRRDGWSFTGVAEAVVHLMTQAMEAWIVADPEALAEFYGQNFHIGWLPTTKNLETVQKQDVANSLERATRDTTKGAYHKIKHVNALLSMIDATKVCARCPCCRLLFTDLHTIIAAA